MSSKREDFSVKGGVGNSCTVAGPAAAAAPSLASKTAEECWMQLKGARLRYLRAGSGPALVLVHGLLGYSFSWRYTMPALAPYATVYAPDLLGAGFSDRPRGLDCRLEATSARLADVIEQLGIFSFDLLGTSHGGAVAMMAAARFRGDDVGARVRKLILVAPVNPYSSHGRWLAPFLGSWLGSALFRHTIARMTGLYAYGLRRMYGDPRRIPPGTLEGYMAPISKPGFFEYGLSIARTWTKDLRQLQQTLPKLRDIPTLLMWGSADPAVHAASAAPLAEHFATCQSIVFPGVGHLPYEECPEEFNRALSAFLTQDSAKSLRSEPEIC